MQHSIRFIGSEYERISTLRQDNPVFSAEKFFQFAKDNQNKYSIIENGDDLLVSTWYSDNLIKDFKNGSY